jgi:hypothetical protein
MEIFFLDSRIWDWNWKLNKAKEGTTLDRTSAWTSLIAVLRGIRLEELKFNEHCTIFVLFDKKFPILD